MSVLPENVKTYSLGEVLEQLEKLGSAITQMTDQLYAIPDNAFSTPQALDLDRAHWTLDSLFKKVERAPVLEAALKSRVIVRNIESLMICINEQASEFDVDSHTELTVFPKKENMFTITPDMIISVQVDVNVDYQSDDEGGSYTYRSIRDMTFEWDEELIGALLDMWFDFEVDENADDEERETAIASAKEELLEAFAAYLSEAIPDNYYSDEALDLDALVAYSSRYESITLYPAKTMRELHNA